MKWYIYLKFIFFKLLDVKLLNSKKYNYFLTIFGFEIISKDFENLIYKLFNDNFVSSFKSSDNYILKNSQDNIQEGIKQSNVLENININDSLYFNDLFIDYVSYYNHYNLFIEIYYFIFVFFTLVVIFFSFFLIFISNPIYSVISLIIIYLAASFLIILYEIHFLSVIFILVYLGAVIVLFLFIVMMLNIKVQSNVKILNIFPFIILSIIFFLFFGLPLFFFKNSLFFNSFNNNINLEETVIFDFFSIFNLLDLYLNCFFLENINYKEENILLFGYLLYTYFCVEFLICSFVLLLAMIGCISLTLNKDSKGLKKQDVVLQLYHKNSLYKRLNKY
jgi:NADH:ubiquinone oxidoreductase subunit 6 (subunit J)